MGDDKKGTAWVFLYNCLYMVSSNYNDIAQLESQIFEIFDELDTTMRGGLNERTLLFFLQKRWINDELKVELEQFRNYMRNIERDHWNADDFDNVEDWKLARSWAESLMIKLRMERRGWNSDGQMVIYTDN